MNSGIYVNCSQCGQRINLNSSELNSDYIVETHDGEECYFCEECNDGDYGLVKCGKCEKQLRRYEAFLNNKYLYLCNYCANSEIKYEVMKFFAGIGGRELT